MINKFDDVQKNIRVGQCMNLAQNHMLKMHVDGGKVSMETAREELINLSRFYWSVIDSFVLDLKQSEMNAKVLAGKVYKSTGQQKPVQTQENKIPNF